MTLFLTAVGFAASAVVLLALLSWPFFGFPGNRRGYWVACGVANACLVITEAISADTHWWAMGLWLAMLAVAVWAFVETPPRQTAPAGDQ